VKLALTGSPFLLGAYGAAALATAIGTFALLLSFPSLPPEVPLLLTAGEGITPKIFLFAIPLLSISFLVGDAWVSEILLRRREPSAALFPAFLSLFTSVILSFSLVRILRIFPIPELPFEETISPLLLPLGTALGLGFGLSALFAWIGHRLRLFDQPHGPYRQVRPIPRLGALPLFLTFSAGALFFIPFDSRLAGLLLGGAVISLVQTIDDLRPLPPWVQGGGHLLAGLIVIGGGVRVDFINNPLSPWIGSPHLFFEPWVGALFTLIWIFVLVNVVDFLDGLDGLAAGIGVIAGATIVAISFIAGTPLTAVLGIILTGALLGFLPFNFFPARIYLGGGAFLLGYFLAVLSIFSGAKTGTAILVLALPIIDAIFVIYRRLREGRSPFRGDFTHLHHRLLAVGLSQPQIVLLEWGIVGSLAGVALGLTGINKLAAIGLVFIAALLANRLLLRRSGSPSPKERKL